MPASIFWRAALLVGLFAFSLIACAPARFSETGIVMNAPCRITVYAEGPPPWEMIFAQAAEKTVPYNHRVPESPLAALNKAGSSRVPAPLFAILQKALAVAEASRGAFDPTVLPLMELWAFESGGRLPAPEEIRAARARLGYRNVRLRAPDEVRLSSGATLDLGAIGEGAVSDAIAGILDELGYENYLVDAAGEITARGEKPGGVPWSVAIRSPRKEGMSRTAPDYASALLGVLGKIDLAAGDGKKAISTSGDYEKFFVRDDVAYHHIIDPRTGYPARGAVSVTILAGNCAEADALATAAFVLGFEEGARLVEDWPNAEGLVVRENAGRLEMKATSGFPEIIPLAEEP